MYWLMLYTWGIGALFTTALVTECVVDHEGCARLKIAALPGLLALVAWPIMLGSAVGECMRDARRLR